MSQYNRPIQVTAPAALARSSSTASADRDGVVLEVTPLPLVLALVGEDDAAADDVDAPGSEAAADADERCGAAPSMAGVADTRGEDGLARSQSCTTTGAASILARPASLIAPVRR